MRGRPIDFLQDADLKFEGEVAKKRAPFPPKHLFFTGVTGNLGKYLLDAFAEKFPQAHLYCLVRGEMEKKSRVTPVKGDLTKPKLGIEENLYEELAEKIEMIVHCGASTNWISGYAMHKSTNVQGTLEVLKFAGHRVLKPIQHISTIGIMPYFKHGNETVITEDQDILHDVPILLPYAQTKWVNEKQVEYARKLGFKINVYRPGQLVCDLAQGVPIQNEYSYLIVEGCRQLQYAPDRDLLLSLTCVDIASAIIAYISLNDEEMNHNYHLVNSEKLNLHQVMEELVKMGHKITFIPTQEWIQKVKSLDLKKTKNPIIPILDILLYSFDHEYTDIDLTNILKAIKGSGILFPTPVDKMLQAYVKGFERKI